MRIAAKIFLFILPNLAFAQSAISVDGVAQRVAAVGAKSVVDSMYQDGTAWRRVLAGIATGDDDWLEVAVRLRSGTDAATREQLILSIGEALGHHPLSVLKIAETSFGVDALCGAPDVDDERFNAYTSSIKEIDARINKLGTISDPKLTSLRDECIQKLNESKHAISDFYGIAD